MFRPRDVSHAGERFRDIGDVRILLSDSAATRPSEPSRPRLPMGPIAAIALAFGLGAALSSLLRTDPRNPDCEEVQTRESILRNHGSC